MMSNHFHLLVRVPLKVELSDEELLGRITRFYGKKGILTVLAQESLKTRGKIDPHVRAAVVRRMGDVSEFIKEFKQRFSRWYNKTYQRFGTLWAERFTSVLVEDVGNSVKTVAALNGVQAVRHGLLSFLTSKDWAGAAAEYRTFLFVTGGSANRSDKVRLDPKVIRAELARGGELSLGQVLRLRVRHITDGVVLGSREFVNEMFSKYRDRFSARRKDGARPIRGVPIPEVRVMRDLRVDTVG